MWITSCILLIAVMLWGAWNAGPRHALGVGFILSLLWPTWFNLQILELPWDVRVVTCLCGLAIYVIYNPTTFISLPLIALDFAALGFVTTAVLSDWMNEDLSLRAPLLIGGQWTLPYVAGRVALQKVEDVRKLLPWVVGVCIVLSLTSVFEAFSGTNVFEWIFGKGQMYEFVVAKSGRWGMATRATGPTRHPICFGTMLLMLLPWSIYGASRAWRGGASKWWLTTPLITVFGIIFAASRAPILGIVPLVFATLVVAKPRWRPFLGGLAAIATVLLAVNFQTAVKLTETSVDDTPVHHVAVTIGERRVRVEKDATLWVDGEEVARSGARQRIYVFQVYELAMRNAGWFGFGTERLSSKPLRVPVAKENIHLLHSIWVENGYIMIILRFGYLGASFFLLGLLLTVVTYARMGWLPNQHGGLFCASMAGGIFSSLFVLLTVWMPPDFGFVIVWNIGAAAGLFSAALADRRTLKMQTELLTLSRIQ